MGRAGDEALPEGIDDLVLEGANPPHRPVQAEQLVVAEVVGPVARGASSTGIGTIVTGAAPRARRSARASAASSRPPASPSAARWSIATFAHMRARAAIQPASATGRSATRPVATVAT